MAKGKKKRARQYHFCKPGAAVAANRVRHSASRDGRTTRGTQTMPLPPAPQQQPQQQPATAPAPLAAPEPRLTRKRRPASAADDGAEADAASAPRLKKQLAAVPRLKKQLAAATAEAKRLAKENERLRRSIASAREAALGREL